MKHSPAPWYFDQEQMMVRDLNGREVASLSVRTLFLEGEESQNQKIITAAPLLYAVIERIVLHSDEPSIFTLNEILEEARSAIELVRAHQYQS